jgi:hypothetical protein
MTFLLKGVFAFLVIKIKGHSCRLKEHAFSKQLYPKQGGDGVSASPP